jgi:hypothetical protein
MTANWFASNPATWPDLQTLARQAVARLYPRGLITNAESDEYKDVQAKGDIYTWLQEALWWVRTSYWPQYDSEALFLGVHETALSIAQAATTALRQSSVIAHYRTLRRTLAEELTQAIFCRVFGDDDPAEVSFASPSTADIYRCFPWAVTDYGTLGTAPGARYRAGMVYDTVNDVCVLFGGDDAGGLDAETWTYASSTQTWTNKAPAGPPGAREKFAFAFRETDGLCYLFGGTDAGGLDAETWSYNASTNTWANLAPAASPGARDGCQMVWDQDNDRLVMFGGEDAGGLDAETWAYSFSGNTWTNLAPASNPSARKRHAMVWDTANDRILLFGGMTNIGASTASAETWEFIDGDWSQITPTNSPTARYGHTAVWCDHRQSMIIFGGWDNGGANRLDDDNNEEFYEPAGFSGNWHPHFDQPVPNDSLGINQGQVAAYDSEERLIVVFGGNPSVGVRSDDTWHYAFTENANSWSRHKSSLHIYSTGEDVDEDYQLGQTLLARCTPSGDVWTVGRYLECEYGSTADGTEFGTYNTACYGTRD